MSLVMMPFTNSSAKTAAKSTPAHIKMMRRCFLSASITAARFRIFLSYSSYIK